MEFMCDLTFRQSCWRHCNYTVIGFDKTTVCDWQETFLELLQEDRPDNRQFYCDTVYIDQCYRVKFTTADDFCLYIQLHVQIAFILKLMPMYSYMSQCHSVSKFDMKWGHWQDDCQRRLKENGIATNLNIETTWQRLCVYRVANYL